MLSLQVSPALQGPKAEGGRREAISDQAGTQVLRRSAQGCRNQQRLCSLFGTALSMFILLSAMLLDLCPGPVSVTKML